MAKGGTVQDLRREPPLRGIVLRDDRDTLVVQASEVEVQRFARAQVGRPVQVESSTLRVRVDPGITLMTTGDAAPFSTPLTPGQLTPGGLLYDAAGRPVAYVRNVQVHTERLDVTAIGSHMRTMMSGLTRVEITAEGVAGVTVR